MATVDSQSDLEADVCSSLRRLRICLKNRDAAITLARSQLTRDAVNAAYGDSEAAWSICDTLGDLEARIRLSFTDHDRRYYLPLVDAAERQCELAEEELS